MAPIVTSDQLYAGQDVESWVASEATPAITGWERIEASPRSADFGNSLKAEIADALWMVTRGWQAGEHFGSDAASPISAHVMASTVAIDRVRLGTDSPRGYDGRLPLETMIEREHPPINLDFALRTARMLLKSLKAAVDDNILSRDYSGDLRDAYPLSPPPAGTDEDEDAQAYQEVAELRAAVSGRSIDGGALYARIRSGGDPLQPLAAVAAADANPLKFVLATWYAAVRARHALDLADESKAWDASALTYNAACASPGFGTGQIVLAADAYRGGHLDWYSFDIAKPGVTIAAPASLSQSTPVSVQSSVQTFMPTEIRFPGMPNSRWFEFEDRFTDFGKIDAKTTDIARLLFVEFALVYGNDWFLLPLDVPVGTLTRIDALAVTNSFGEKIWIAAAGGGPSGDWHQWAMYGLTNRGTVPSPNRALFVPPIVDRMLESAPVEKIAVVRDDVANMAWAIEIRITLSDGSVRDGYDAYQRRLAYRRRLSGQSDSATAPISPSGAPLDYKLMSERIPENWIPFVPVRVSGSNRQIQLQRAAMLTGGVSGAVHATVRARTQTIRQDPAAPYFLHEESVPRAGVEIVLSCQRARRHDGSVIVWYGKRVGVGRGAGASGLAFDQVELS